MRARNLLLASASICLGLLVALVGLEVLFRFLPVSSGLRTQPVTVDDPILRFEPYREFTYSVGWALEYVNRVRVNNAGFVNSQDYDAKDTSPLLAVVGDSYVEALVVPPEKALHERLATAVANEGRVYSFAGSGASLSQYLLWAEHAYRAYGAAGAVFVVVGNDFDESLFKYKSAPGFHYFADHDGQLALRLVEYRPGRLRRLAYISAFGRYLLFNLKIQYANANFTRLLNRLGRDEMADAPAFVGNTSGIASNERMDDSKRAVDAFFRELAARFPADPGMFVFVVDANRHYGPDGLMSLPDSYFARMRRYFMDAAESMGHVVVDMQPIFSEHYRVHRSRFEHENDAHWNALAHELAAKAVSRTRTFQSMYPGVTLQ